MRSCGFYFRIFKTLASVWKQIRNASLILLQYTIGGRKSRTKDYMILD